MKDRKEKDKLNDDLLDQVSGGSHELDTPPDCDFKGCPYGTPCLHGLPCPKSTEIEFDPDTREL
ncbi:MAG: hypothetical protein IKS55_11490 [Oscillospiraceae bacterium]|nr:hypothetical protein [Oscillospiraceae bacterium]